MASTCVRIGSGRDLVSRAVPQLPYRPVDVGDLRGGREERRIETAAVSESLLCRRRSSRLLPARRCKLVSRWPIELLSRTCKGEQGFSTLPAFNRALQEELTDWSQLRPESSGRRPASAAATSTTADSGRVQLVHSGHSRDGTDSDTVRSSFVSARQPRCRPVQGPDPPRGSCLSF